MTFKYVMFQYTLGRVQHHYALLFPEQLVHSEVAEAHWHLKHRTSRGWVRPQAVSAGFVAFNGPVVTCYGDSESLKMKPHPDDANIIFMGSNGSCMFPR